MGDFQGPLAVLFLRSCQFCGACCPGALTCCLRVLLQDQRHDLFLTGPTVQGYLTYQASASTAKVCCRSARRQSAMAGCAAASTLTSSRPIPLQGYLMAAPSGGGAAALDKPPPLEK